jgi:hypothetical protein
MSVVVGRWGPAAGARAAGMHHILELERLGCKGLTGESVDEAALVGLKGVSRVP